MSENGSTWKGIFRDPFWKPNVGHFALFAALLIGYGRLSERFDTFARNQSNDEAKMERMDRDGTNASKEGIHLEGQVIAGHEKRIEKIEDAISGISVMREKIDAMRDELHDIKNIRK
jgi:hypothetical protein